MAINWQPGLGNKEPQVCDLGFLVGRQGIEP